MGQDLY